ncbi:Unknown protein [Striga hermonthica]|uniref:Protein FAR1-RELATED SEQUENCE n=1 Tax=Striga hermonthica TaxID=68872 RepID=A0A9N7NXT7_STRHE|nr:Unknown protein [Striga hermonthica]
MPRWTKLAVRNSMFCVINNISEQCAQIDDKKFMMNKLWSDIHVCMGLVEVRMDLIVEFFKLVGDHKHKILIEEEGGSDKTDKEQSFESFVGMSAPQEIHIQPPTQSKNKGSGKRLNSDKEKSIEQSQSKRRICKTCGERASHNARTCPKKQ